MEEKEDLDIFNKFLDLVKLQRERKAKLQNDQGNNYQCNCSKLPQPPNEKEESHNEDNLLIPRKTYELRSTMSAPAKSQNSSNEDSGSEGNCINNDESSYEEGSREMSSEVDELSHSPEPPQPVTRAETQMSKLQNNEEYQKQLEKRELARREYLKHQLEKIKLKKMQQEKRAMENFKKRIGKKVIVRRWAANPNNLDRVKNGYHTQVFKGIKADNEEELFKLTRMPKSVYDILFNQVRKHLRKPRQRISTDERISLTLLFLAHGESFNDLAAKYKMGRATARQTVLDTCQIFWNVLSPIYLSEQTSNEYQEIARDFESTWNMPNCVGALGGRHIPIKVIRKDGPSSMVLLAACDAKYMFTAITVESNDNHIKENFKVTSFGKKLFEGNLPLPADVPLPNTDTPCQYYFIADSAFPLTKQIMRPYPDNNLDTKKQVFNYRLNRARRTIENTFGVLSARWRVLLSTLDCLPQNSETIILACVVLHNFIMWHDLDHWYCPETYVDNDSSDNNCIPGGWRTDVAQSGKALESIKTTNYENSDEGIQIQDYISDYFSNAFLLEDDIDNFDANEIQFYVT